MKDLTDILVPLRLGPLIELEPQVRAGLRQRYYYMSEAYAKESAAMRREFARLELPAEDRLYSDYEREVLSNRREALTLSYQADVPINLLKLENNFRYAKANGSKYLIQEDLFGFPIMNTVLGEGPYTPQHEDRFGDEDYHAILYSRGSLWLVYQQYGFEQGRLVERV